MTECDTVKNMLSAYIEGLLEPQSREKVKSHLELCIDCKQVFSNVAFLTDRLHSVNPVSVSDGFNERLRQKLVHPQENNNAVLSSRNLFYGVSGAAILTAVFVFLTLDFTTPGSENLPAKSPMNMVSPQASSQSTETIIDNREPELTDHSTKQDSLLKKQTDAEKRNIKLIEQ